MNRPTLQPALLNPLLALQPAARIATAPGGAADEARPFEFARALSEARQSVRPHAPESGATAPRPPAAEPPPRAPQRPADRERPESSERSERSEHSASSVGNRGSEGDATARPRPTEETARPALQAHREAGSLRASRGPTTGHQPARGQAHPPGTRKSTAQGADTEAGPGCAGEAERAKAEGGVDGTPAGAGLDAFARMGANQDTSSASKASATAADATWSEAAAAGTAGTIVTAGNSGGALGGDASPVDRLARGNTLPATGAVPGGLAGARGTPGTGDASTPQARAAMALQAGAGDALASPSLPDAAWALRMSSSAGGELGGPLATPAAGSPNHFLPGAALASLIAPSAPSATAADLSPREATLANPPGSEGFVHELGTQLSVFVREGVQHARLQLHPQELGPVLVRIQLEGQTAQVHMAAELPQTRSALEQALPTLASQLSDAGITLTGGGVSERPPGGFGADDRTAREPSSGRGSETAPADSGASRAAAAEAAPTGPWSRARGLVDLIA